MNDLQANRPPRPHRPLSLPRATHAPNPLIPIALIRKTISAALCLTLQESPHSHTQRHPAAKSFINNHLPNDARPRYILELRSPAVYRKFSMSIKSPPEERLRVYRIVLRSGDTVRPKCTWGSRLATGRLAPVEN